MVTVFTLESAEDGNFYLVCPVCYWRVIVPDTDTMNVLTRVAISHSKITHQSQWYG